MKQVVEEYGRTRKQRTPVYFSMSCLPPDVKIDERFIFGKCNYLRFRFDRKEKRKLSLNLNPSVSSNSSL
jgi:hypothetical protein